MDKRIVQFFERMPQAQPLYEKLRDNIIKKFPDVAVKIQKSQISFSNRHQFAFVWLPVRKMKNRPERYIVVSFGLPYRIESSRIIEAVEPYPSRWTHHLIIADPLEIDGELMKWIEEAYNFALTK
ncbi:DUF5655 domain-containing protein [Proteiniclasticum sp. C24MP]|uniref:DUF5655 domain-containing protein n=1 Tax=Proteiniclasticum sp. C24MP TaxID=3374101 RepID=UPI003754A5FD